MRRMTLGLLVVLLVPAAHAVPTTLYGHVTEPYQDFAMNTQEPDPSFTVDSAVGIATHTFTCTSNPPMSGAFQEYHTMYGYSSPSRVAYDAVDGDARPRTSPERGLMADARLDPASPLVLHWYLSEGDVSGDRNANPLPTANVVVEATLREGDAISIGDEAYNTGAVIAHGRSVPATLAGPLSQGVQHDEVGGRTVYHFVVPLDVASPVIPRATGFNLRVDVFVDNPLCGEGHVMPNGVALHSSVDHRPRLELGVLDPVTLTASETLVDEGGLSFQALLTDVWGKYDLLAVNVSVERPGHAPVPLAMDPVIPVSHEHYAQDRDYRRLWRWNSTEPLPDGGFMVNVTASTLSGLKTTWTIPYAGAEAQAMPGPTPLVLLLGLAGLASLWRRKQG